MALPTQGFALSSLGHAPEIPANVGKIDAASIYDRVLQGLNTAEALRTTLARQQATDAELQAQRQQAPLRTSLLASQAATAGDTADLSGRTLPGKVLATNAALDADLIAEQNKRDSARALATAASTMNPAQRVVFDRSGPPSTTNVLASRQGGNAVSTATKTENVGGVEVPVATTTSTAPAGPLITPITGVGGLPGGAAITTMGPDGKQTTSHIAAPLGALNNITTNGAYVPVGSGITAEGAPTVKYQFMGGSAAGGIPKPIGSAIERLAADGPPGTPPTEAQSAAPVISKDAAKAIEDANSEIEALQGRKIELANISNAADAFIKGGIGAGRIAGPIRSFLGDAKAQEFVGSVQNALSTALQPLRGTGRVSNTEFNQALSALPKITDQPETIRNKLQYLDLVTDWGLARQQAYLDGLGKGQNRYQAMTAAKKEVPIPEVPNFYEGQTVAGVAVPAAQAPTPVASARPTVSTQQQFDALPSGAEFVTPSGAVRRKP
jgi:hypothetical protein